MAWALTLIALMGMRTGVHKLHSALIFTLASHMLGRSHCALTATSIFQSEIKDIQPEVLTQHLSLPIWQTHWSLVTCSLPSSLWLSQALSVLQAFKKKLAQLSWVAQVFKLLQSLSEFHKYLTSKLIYVKICSYLINLRQFNKSCSVLINDGLG